MTLDGEGRERAVGYGEALLAATLWGSSGIFSVHLFAEGMTPASLALLRPALGVGILGTLLWIRSGRFPLTQPLRSAMVLGLGGGSLVGLFQIAYQSSIDAVGVPATVALVYLAPPLVVAVSGPLLGEWPGARRVLLALVTLVGVWLTVSGAERVVPMFGDGGVGWGVLSGVGYAGYTLFGRFAAPRYGSTATMLYSTAGACVWLAFLLPPLLGEVSLPPTGRAWALLVIFAVATVSGAQFLFFDALRRIAAGRAAITAAVEPVVAAVLAALLLSQDLSPRGWAGIALVVAGVVGVARER